jgi:hypothetical protein
MILTLTLLWGRCGLLREVKIPRHSVAWFQSIEDLSATSGRVDDIEAAHAGRAGARSCVVAVSGDRFFVGESADEIAAMLEV